MSELTTVTLAEVADVLMGQSPPGHTYNDDSEGLPFLQGSAEFGEHTPSPVKWCSTPTKVAEAGDLMVSVRAPVGDTNFADQKTAIGRGLAIVRANQASSNAYLRLVIQHSTGELLARSGGGMFSSITANGLRGFTFMLPTLVEQRRIVDLMAAVDAQVEALDVERERAWSLLAALRESLLGSLPSVPLSEVCSIEARLVDPRGSHYSKMLHVGVEAIEKGTGRVVGARTAAEDGLISGKYLFGPGDVVYSKIRPELRKVAVPGIVGLCSADAYPLTPRAGLSPRLLGEVLLLESVVEQVVARSGRTKMPKVNRQELFTIDVPLGDSSKWAAASAVLVACRGVAEGLELEGVHIHAVRDRILTLLLSGDISIPESFAQLLPAS